MCPSPDLPAADGQRASEDIAGCRSFILSALIATMEERSRPGVNWVENERTAVAVAANQWAESHGHDRRVTVADIERIEGCAVGHIDYASKLALYVAEFIVAPEPWMVSDVS